MAVLLLRLSEKGRQHIRKNPCRPPPTMDLPEASEREQSRNSTCGEADRVACAGSGLAELQETADNAESSASREDSEVGATDCTIPFVAPQTSQLHRLLPLVVDFGCDGIYIERYRYYRFRDLLAER